MRSPSSAHDSKATTTGSALITRPAAVAEVSATPQSMQIENRKLPKKDCRKSCRDSKRLSGGSVAPRQVHGSSATAAIAKRKSASAKIGNSAVSGLTSAT
jgi:hypothetical protein